MRIPAPVMGLGMPARLVFLCSLCLCGESSAQADLRKPYRLDVVLHVAEHRLLTDVFRDRVGRELRDGLQAALGDLARVRLTHEHPRLADVLRRGLRQSLDAWDERSGVKTHFVLIDFVAGQYEIQARQHDGLTGLSSPAVRRERTPDRDFVARTAALLVEHDFGMVGTVLGEPDAAGQVKVRLGAGGLGPLDRWVEKGEVLWLVPPGAPRPVPWALLQVQEPPGDDGVCTCRYHHRYQGSGIGGFQCLEIGTTVAPLRARFLQRELGGRLVPLANELGVEVQHFQGEDPNRVSRSTKDGVIDTSRDGEKGLFHNVAFVKVTRGVAGTPPFVPVAMVDEEPVIIDVNASTDKNIRDSILKASWERNLSDSVLVQRSVFSEIKAMSADPQKRGQILQTAEEGLERSRLDYARLTAERDRLQVKPSHQDQQRLKALKEGEAALALFVAEQKKIEAEENDPGRKALRARVEEARLLEKDLEIDRALALYKQALDGGLDSPELRKHYEDLEARWKPKSDKHLKAREFIYTTWPKSDSIRLNKELFAQAREAFKVCREAGDLFSVQKLVKGTEGHAIRLKKELDALAPRAGVNIEDDKQARALQQISTDLLALADEVEDYLSKASK
jgi:hypothetical protein